MNHISNALKNNSTTNTIAFVHDRLFHHGGGSMVFEQLIKVYQETTSKSTIFVLFSPFEEFSGIPVVTALPQWLNQLMAKATQANRPILSWLFDYRNLMPLYPLLVWILRRKILATNPDKVVVSSFAAVKNVVDKKFENTNTILYLHSPMQYIRENYNEYILKLTGLKKWIFIGTTKYLRKWDKTPRNYSTRYANSNYTRDCAKELYNWQGGTVWYPGIQKEFINTTVQEKPYEYYLYIGRLVQFVRETDLIIKLCNELGVPLLVMGSGPDEDYLKTIAGNTITFLGSITDPEKKVEIIRNAKGVINLAKESCGIATMEALSLGVPVLGFNQGGTKELLFDEDFGHLVDSKEFENLITNFPKFMLKSYNRKNIKKKFLEYYQNNIIETTT